MPPIIQVEHVSKQYRLGEVGTGTLSHDLKRWWYRARGKEDPYARIGEVNDRSTKGSSDYVWALQDINFSVAPGKVLGIIGRNGAGKSTLLKLLSKTTAPTTGKIKVRGRIASLLEVGTGFHPELTGRENIFLNGAILGMTRKEISRKFDEIVDFAGVERYIDTPVKRYSSGMYVRLAFAVAAHLEPEILIVDEVLAVGDAEFQKKCLGKMKDVSVNDGRTVLFVSHNMGAIASLCSNILLLENGKNVFNGPTSIGIEKYLASDLNNNNKNICYINSNPKEIDIVKVAIKNANNHLNSNFNFKEQIFIEVSTQHNTYNIFTRNVILGIRISDIQGRNIFTVEKEFFRKNKSENTSIFKLVIPKETLVPNLYFATIALHIPNVEVISYLENSVRFVIEETGTDFFKYAGHDYGCVFINCNWI